ncbi:MAG TPA: class II glutamine amidotransferase [Ktedonobacteraceae bacterium]|nr:class II glutamine amidotransferase [Ktedonobacteraceae bacterium]
MCRLLGYVAREPVAAARLLEDTFAAFVEMSHRHGDGWGLVWYNEHNHLQMAKAPEAAHASSEFAGLKGSIRSDALIGHLRWASPGFAPCLENTHPFVRGQVAFAHNGSIASNEAIEALIASHLRANITGATDSERYFLALLSAFEKASPVESLRVLLAILRQRLQSTSLNCLLLTPETLYAVCDFDANAPLAQKDPNYYHLQYRITRDAVVVTSSGLSQGTGWKTLKNGQMLLVERGTLKVTIVDVAQNTRSSIQEQYLSQLQR